MYLSTVRDRKTVYKTSSYRKGVWFQIHSNDYCARVPETRSWVLPTLCLHGEKSEQLSVLNASRPSKKSIASLERRGRKSIRLHARLIFNKKYINIRFSGLFFLGILQYPSCWSSIAPWAEAVRQILPHRRIEYLRLPVHKFCQLIRY